MIRQRAYLLESRGLDSDFISLLDTSCPAYALRFQRRRFRSGKNAQRGNTCDSGGNRRHSYAADVSQKAAAAF